MVHAAGSPGPAHTKEASVTSRSNPLRRPIDKGWIAVAVFALAAVGFTFQQMDDATRVLRERRLPSLGGMGNADSNGRMIAVTGVDVTGQSILYLVDTVNYHIAIYQASGGSPSTQGVKLVGARNIALDMQLDGFNDKTIYEGRPLKYSDLEKKFEDL